MTDRYNGLFVVLKHDIRDDDAECLIKAISLLKGVHEVTGHIPAKDFDSYVHRSRLKVEVRDLLYQFLDKP